MANFDKYTNYRDGAGISSVVFGANSPVLEVELNEMQEIQKTMLRTLIKNVIGDGINDLNKILCTQYKDNSGGKSVLMSTVSFTDDCVILCDGYIINCGGLSCTTVMSDNKTIYLWVFEEEVDYTSNLYENGNIDGKTISNWIKDSRVLSETTRRKVVKCALRGDKPSDSNVIYIPIVKINSATKNVTKLINEVRNIRELTSNVRDITPLNAIKSGTYECSSSLAVPSISFDTGLDEIDYIIVMHSNGSYGFIYDGTNKYMVYTDDSAKRFVSADGKITINGGTFKGDRYNSNHSITTGTYYWTALGHSSDDSLDKVRKEEYDIKLSSNTDSFTINTDMTNIKSVLIARSSYVKNITYRWLYCENIKGIVYAYYSILLTNPEPRYENSGNYISIDGGSITINQYGSDYPIKSGTYKVIVCGS